MSAIQEIYKLFYKNRGQALNFTPEKASRAMDDFWALIISSGFKFNKNDLRELRKWSDENYYRTWYGPSEHHYSLSVIESNISFAQAYENYRGRKPFIFYSIDYPFHHVYTPYTCHGSGKTTGRLVISASFPWMGEIVKVTSFKDELHALIACAYYPNPNPNDFRKPTKIKKRFIITVKDLQKQRRDTSNEQRATKNENTV